MKLQHVNPHNVAHLVPEWLMPPFFLARNINELLSENVWMRPLKKFDPRQPVGGLGYWITAKPRTGTTSFWDFEVSVWDEDEFFEGTEGQRAARGAMLGMLRIQTPIHDLLFPLVCVFRGAPALAGTHTVYRHSVSRRDGPSDYVGITKHMWSERLAQHNSEAKRGSHLLFHRAIRECGGVRYSRVEHSGLSYELAMEWEEHFTDRGMLYPHGLNMIPGGFAGLRYLGSLGHKALTLDQRDAALTRVMERDRLLDGSPNPLCAARWASDREYVNSVICGHSDRLTVDQVRNIRMLSASGYNDGRVAQMVADSPARVRRVLDNKRYSRVT